MRWLKSLLKGLHKTPASAGETSIGFDTNFTPRAKRVFALAYKEAERLRHNFVGTEHVLLGLIGLGDGVAANVLIKRGFNVDAARMKVEEIDGTGPNRKMPIHVPYTPRMKQVVALAQESAQTLNHTYVGTEHLLLGILTEGNGVAARALRHSKIDLEMMRKEILDEITPRS